LSGGGEKNRKTASILENGGILIATGSVWKYWDIGNLPAELWRSENYDDSHWSAEAARSGSSDLELLSNKRFYDATNGASSESIDRLTLNVRFHGIAVCRTFF